MFWTSSVVDQIVYIFKISYNINYINSDLVCLVITKASKYVQIGGRGGGGGPGPIGSPQGGKNGRNFFKLQKSSSSKLQCLELNHLDIYTSPDILYQSF